MRPGDLFIVHFGGPIFPWWGDKSRPMPVPIGHMRPGDLGIILEDTIASGGNGVRVLTHEGATGWCYRRLLSPVVESP